MSDTKGDVLEAEAAKAQGMATAELHATERWMLSAMVTVLFCADTLPEFTSDDVWEVLRNAKADPLETERNPKALGAVMLKAAKRGWIEKTGMVRNSKRKSLHASPRTIWRRA